PELASQPQKSSPPHQTPRNLTQSGFQSSTARGGAAPPNSGEFASALWWRRQTRYPRRRWRASRTSRRLARMTPSAVFAMATEGCRVDDGGGCEVFGDIRFACPVEKMAFWSLLKYFGVDLYFSNSLGPD
ncbi:hypothetical protein PHJA_001221200, partial [Phtheirospermum japonicum]